MRCRSLAPALYLCLSPTSFSVSVTVYSKIYYVYKYVYVLYVLYLLLL